jgi:uncharacterized protein YkwD
MSLAAVAVWSVPVAAYLAGRWGFPNDVATAEAIGIFVASFEILRRMGGSGLQGSAEVLLRDLPSWRGADQLAGLATGAVRGAVSLTLVLVVVLVLPVGSSLQASVRRSYTAQAVSVLWPSAVAAPAQSLAADNALQSAFHAVNAAGASTLPAKSTLAPPTSVPTADPDDERQFLSMTNLARSQAGANALTADSGLTDAARQHSLDMVNRAYFAHESPAGTSPSDRIRAAAVPFHRVAENIVYAPTLADAFDSIMASPEHRDNQLSPDYSRVGIGIVPTANGVIVTEDFAD